MAAALRPLFVTVNMGSWRIHLEQELGAAEVCQRHLGLPTVLHLTCTNMRKKMVDEALEACKELGVRNILALRGDPPREEYKEDEPDDEDEEMTLSGPSTSSSIYAITMGTISALVCCWIPRRPRRRITPRSWQAKYRDRSTLPSRKVQGRSRFYHDATDIRR